LKTGDTVKGIVRSKRRRKYFSLLKPTEVNGRDLALSKTVLLLNIYSAFPEEKFNLQEVILPFLPEL
jgi:transcription termination factor Rho